MKLSDAFGAQSWLSKLNSLLTVRDSVLGKQKKVWLEIDGMPRGAVAALGDDAIAIEAAVKYLDQGIARQIEHLRKIGIEVEDDFRPKTDPAPLPRFVLLENGGVVVDNSTGLWWAAAESDSELDHDAATAYCLDFRLGGYDDWRMPTRAEVESILDPERHAPALPPLFRSYGGYAWTSTQTAWTRGNTGPSRSFFVVDMGYGDVNYYLADYRFRVRPVRYGGPVATLEAFAQPENKP